MKNRILYALIAVMALALALCMVGCSTTSKPNMGDATASSASGSTSTSVDTSTDTDVSAIDEGDASASVDIGEDASLLLTADTLTRKEVDGYIDGTNPVLGDVDAEYCAHILLSVSQPVTDFKLWSLQSDIDEDGSLTVCEETLKGSTDSVTPEQTALINCELGEILPIVGISFTTEDGAVKHYYLSESGKDGSILLTAYEPVQATADTPEQIIATYQTAIAEEWDRETLSEKLLSWMLVDCIQTLPKTNVGYWRGDIDGNGTEELLIGASSEDTFFNGMVFALYTMDDNGAAQLIVTSEERNRFYWCGDNTLDNTYSSGAADSGTDIYSLNGAKLVLKEGIHNSEDGWTMTDADGNTEAITDMKAGAFMDDYDTLHQIPELTPFTVD